MKKYIFSAALLMSFAAVSFAGNPKGETKETSSPTEVKAKEDLTTYYVVGQSGSNYLLSTNSSNEANCSGSPVFPCKFTSTDPALGSSISKSTVDNEDDDIVIIARRQTLP